MVSHTTRRITEEHWKQVLNTETGYEVLDCSDDFKGYSGGRLCVQTLVYPRRKTRQNILPSKRYIDIIREGALEWNLSAAWQDSLRLQPSYTPELDPRQVAGALVSTGSMLTLLGPIGLAVAANSLAKPLVESDSTQDEQEPQAQVLDSFQDVTWKLHDEVWSKLFGDGGTNEI
ncbi:hypothetical protein CYMTET_13674 [Cymbomonas tetramitiformis]|uniref:Uncharacterized protein n=1 Tax=Cymbomonas tetramitiformis TaxID=36881 RepID=A0AAE0GHW9_9CHLO|nr:hypothetical protein CYMTET_13674 [Cymbomonas tetramitiformis]